MTHFSIAAITDELSETDLEVALQAMSDLGMDGAELRVVDGRNIVDLTDDEVAGVRRRVEAHGMRVVSIASPLLKCVLPGGPPIDPRLQQDVFGSTRTFDDQEWLARRSIEIAVTTGASIVRVFSYWRTVAPEECRDRIAESLWQLAEEAWKHGVTIGLENEHACNVGTGAEAARLLALVEHPGLKLVWDPANAAVLGETPFPDGYAALPPYRIVHVHAKDCDVHDRTPTWGLLGEMSVDWKGQIEALVRDGYKGAISLETHWRGADGNRLEASILCGRALRALVTS